MPSSIRKIFIYLIFLPLAVIAATFAVANRTVISVALDPLPYTLNLPLYALVLGIGFVGFIVGAATAWLSGHQSRKALRKSRGQLKRVDREMHGLRAQLASPTGKGADTHTTSFASSTRDRG